MVASLLLVGLDGFATNKGLVLKNLATPLSLIGMKGIRRKIERERVWSSSSFLHVLELA